MNSARKGPGFRFSDAVAQETENDVYRRSKWEQKKVVRTRCSLYQNRNDIFALQMKFVLDPSQYLQKRYM